MAPDAVTLFFYSFFVFQLPRGHRTRVRGRVRESPLAVATCTRFVVFRVTLFSVFVFCGVGGKGGVIFSLSSFSFFSYLYVQRPSERHVHHQCSQSVVSGDHGAGK